MVTSNYHQNSLELDRHHKRTLEIRDAPINILTDNWSRVLFYIGSDTDTHILLVHPYLKCTFGRLKLKFESGSLLLLIYLRCNLLTKHRYLLARSQLTLKLWLFYWFTAMQLSHKWQIEVFKSHSCLHCFYQICILWHKSSIMMIAVRLWVFCCVSVATATGWAKHLYAAGGSWHWISWRRTNTRPNTAMDRPTERDHHTATTKVLASLCFFFVFD